MILASVRDAEWLAATINTAQDREVNEKVRNSLTAIVRDADLARQLWNRIQPHLPSTMSAERGPGRVIVRPVGLFEPLRVYRYEVGHHFGVNSDHSYRRGDARSLLTLMLYLDDDFDGGATTFPDLAETVVPRSGDALCVPARRTARELSGNTRDETRPAYRRPVRSDVMQLDMRVAGSSGRPITASGGSRPKTPRRGGRSRNRPRSSASARASSASAHRS